MVTDLYCLDCGFKWPISTPALQSELAGFVKKHGSCHCCESKRIVDYSAIMEAVHCDGLDLINSIDAANASIVWVRTPRDFSQKSSKIEVCV